MVWIAGGEFTMGTNDIKSWPSERPAHQVHVDVIFGSTKPRSPTHKLIKFVEATGYITTAERKPDWEELKKQPSAGTPKPAGMIVLVPASLVSTPTAKVRSTE